jgi:hypothetical protein
MKIGQGRGVRWKLAEREPELAVSIIREYLRAGGVGICPPARLAVVAIARERLFTREKDDCHYELYRKRTGPHR